MRRAIFTALLIGLTAPVVAAAQTRGGAPTAQSREACPPDDQRPPTVGSPATPNLSDKLAETKGVICPPTGIDPDIRVPPPGGGQLKVIPPPGTPGGDPSVQPK